MSRTSARSFSVGERVKTCDWVRPERFAGRVGVVATCNLRDNEVGVFFGSTYRQGRDAADAWFRPQELETTGRRHRIAQEGLNPL